MSTRAVYGFKEDAETTHWVYIHYDGYPEGAAIYFKNTAVGKNVWPGDRFEADEFAAGFVASNKDGAGKVRLSKGPKAHGDIEYIYIVSQRADKEIMVEAHDADLTEDGARIGRKFFDGTMVEFIEKAKTLDA
jgi:hypothetical protein